ncbi:MAG: DUF2029 domain-containing protein [Actinobacteria bacterium]|nr:DUF2029 domain-containing protein [Actinomycetota bacterium]
MDWLNRRRIVMYSWSFVAVYIFIAGLSYSSGKGINDSRGQALGSDYICFYAASELAREGDVSGIYDIKQIYRKEVELAGDQADMVGFYYPPTFLLLVLPLAYMPYVVSLAIWISTTLLGYAALLRRIAPDSATLGLALAYPGAFQNAIHGQNGFLTTALLGWGLVLLRGCPVPAGILLGLLTYKPHLALLVFLALLAGRCWEALAAAAFSAGAFALASAAVFGPDAWLSFKDQIPFVSNITEAGYLPWVKMSTVFAASRLVGIGIQPSYILQGIITFCVIILVFWVWHREMSYYLKVSVLIAGIFLATPYAFQYDLALLAAAIAFYGWEGYKKGWLPYEKAVLFVVWIMPQINDPIARFTNIQIVPLILAAFLMLAMRRIYFFERSIL